MCRDTGWSIHIQNLATTTQAGCRYPHKPALLTLQLGTGTWVGTWSVTPHTLRANSMNGVCWVTWPDTLCVSGQLPVRASYTCNRHKIIPVSLTSGRLKLPHICDSLVNKHDSCHGPGDTEQVLKWQQYDPTAEPAIGTQLTPTSTATEPWLPQTCQHHFIHLLPIYRVQAKGTRSVTVSQGKTKLTSVQIHCKQALQTTQKSPHLQRSSWKKGQISICFSGIDISSNKALVFSSFFFSNSILAGVLCNTHQRYFEIR